MTRQVRTEKSSIPMSIDGSVLGEGEVPLKKKPPRAQAKSMRPSSPRSPPGSLKVSTGLDARRFTILTPIFEGEI